MTGMIDHGPAAEEVARLAAGVAEADLDAPTPCEQMTVGQLLAHLTDLSLAFRLGAEKADDEVTRSAPAGPVDPPEDWRDRLPRRLDELVAAWREPAAWDGEATVGGATMPAAEIGMVALDELVLHGWDLAVATSQPFACTLADAEAVLAFTSAVAAAGPEAREGLFGPPVKVPDDAPTLDRALGLAGRDPAWTPPRR